LFVGGTAEAAEDFGFYGQGVFEGEFVAVGDGFEHAGDGEWGHGSDVGGELAGAGHEVFGGEEFVDEADGGGFLSGDDHSGEHEAQGRAAAYEAGEALGAPVARDEAEPGFGEAEESAVAGEAQGAGEGELAAAAEGYTIDAGDDGFAAGFDEGEDLLAALRDGEAGDGVGGGEAADVGTGGEGAVAGCGEEDDADGGLGGQGGEDVFEFVEHLGVEGVPDFRAVEGDGGDGFVTGAEEGFVDRGIGHDGRLQMRCEPQADDTIVPMIKGITTIASIATPEAAERLGSLLKALGFEEGKGWDDGEGRGDAFLAPLGNLELVTGRAPAVPPLLIEVTQLDVVYKAVNSWMIKADGGNFRPEEIVVRLTAIAPTHWNSRLFTVDLAAGLRIGFWESEAVNYGKPVAVEGDLSAAGKRFAIVVARWNAVITERLLQGALDALHRSGCKKEDIEIVRVPGAWEIPSAARTLAESRKVAAIITLGVLLRGETAHYEAIYTEVARGIGQSQQDTGVPHAFGVLTCETLEQALDRAGLKAGNKGFEAAIAAIEMASITEKLNAAKSGTKGRGL